MGKHSKGIRYLGVSGKGKWPHRKITKSKVTPLITKVTSRNNQSHGSMTVFNELFCFFFQLHALVYMFHLC